MAGYWICQKQMHGWILDMAETDAWLDIGYVRNRCMDIYIGFVRSRCMDSH
jgi:hypothetical protein